MLTVNIDELRGRMHSVLDRSVVRVINRLDDEKYQSYHARRGAAKSLDDLIEMRRSLIVDFNEVGGEIENLNKWKNSQSDELVRQINNLGGTPGLIEVLGGAEALQRNMLGIVEHLSPQFPEVKGVIPFSLTIHWKALKPFIYAKHPGINVVLADDPNGIGRTPKSRSAIYAMGEVESFAIDNESGHDGARDFIVSENKIPLNLSETVNALRHCLLLVEHGQKFMVVDHCYDNGTKVFIVSSEIVEGQRFISIKLEDTSKSFQGYKVLAAKTLIDVSGTFGLSGR